MKREREREANTGMRAHSGSTVRKRENDMCARAHTCKPHSDPHNEQASERASQAGRQAHHRCQHSKEFTKKETEIGRQERAHERARMHREGRAVRTRKIRTKDRQTERGRRKRDADRDQRV